MTPPWLALLLLPLLACGDDQPMPAGHTPPPPATTGTGGPLLTSDDSTTAAASQCACAPDQFCAADYVPGDPEPAPEAFTCQAECLVAGSPGYWCFDDSSCCDGGCRCDGLCGVPIDESECAATSTADPTTDASTTDASTTGSTTDASTTDSTTDASTTDASGGSSATGSSTG